MALIDLNGTATGSGGASGPLALVLGVSAHVTGSAVPTATNHPVHTIRAVLSGVGTSSAAWQRVMSFSGSPSGSGDVLDGLVIPLAGIATGHGSLTGTFVRTQEVSVFAHGSGQFNISVPEPVYGIAIVTAFMDVVCVPRPACPHETVATFRWGHTFQRGDLSICITDRFGNPVGPVCITYTLYQVVKGCQLHQVGCATRHPAMAKLGSYYVTGTAGEGGQPGPWVVRWTFQRSFGGSTVQEDFCFQVVDAVLAPIPGDTTQRVCKYGWD